ncbi:FAD NAD-P-binding protein [Rhizoctonia solani]|uniref:FAD NAD-P-binding protein n=1 Tax=Rhizoctonia solani TaxID=456999 RepID=A0A8H7M8T6_9AGAM|nr:FAD NAD-P-binding protein [Rhizoctonia solani]
MRAVLKAALATSICVYGVQASSQHNLHSGQHPLTGQQKFGTDEFKVAIIGAGNYFARWVFRCILAITSKVKIGREYNDNIYEKSDYIGGRAWPLFILHSNKLTYSIPGSTTVRPYDDETIPTVELGGSIYYGDENEETGIWNGNEFVLTLSGGGWRSWWTTAKLFWRYGYSPLKVRTLRGTHIRPSLQLLRRSTFTHITAVPTSKYLTENGVSPLFTHELIEAATRVNYGQNVDDIHALEGMVSMAANGAHSVAGGNWQVTYVRAASGKWHLAVEGADEKTYDAVYRCTIQSTGIKIEAVDLNLEKAFPPVDYVHLHVTLLATTAEHPQGTCGDEWLEKLFGAGTVGWTRRKEWDAYPRLPPTTTFPSVKPTDGLYYVNAFEPFISTMETETIASLNAVDLLLHDRYGRGVCGYKSDEYPNEVKPADFAYGWDC